MRSVLLPKNTVKDLCSNAEIIKNLNETKQYTLMATGLLESVITDPKLTASAAKLWEYLYSKAIMNDEICVKMRYKDLAVTFSRSERTIKRHVEDLKENGYLYVQNNFNYRGQRANTFYLTVPAKTIENLSNVKDRKKREKVKVESFDNTYSDVDIVIDHSVINPALDIPEETHQCLNSQLNENQQDKIVTPDHDINVTPINNNFKKDILINNNSVVVSQFESTKNIEQEPDSNNHKFVLRETFSKNQDVSDQEKIDCLEKQVNSLYVSMNTSQGPERVAIFDEIQKLHTSISSITVMMTQRKQLANSLILGEHHTNKSGSYVDPLINFAQVAGERSLSPSDSKRIKHVVEKYIPSVDRQKVYNEIIYAIRFGALKLSQNGSPLSVSHAASIAIKLIREKRWETPAPLKRKEKLNLHAQVGSHITQFCQAAI